MQLGAFTVQGRRSWVGIMVLFLAVVPIPARTLLVGVPASTEISCGDTLPVPPPVSAVSVSCASNLAEGLLLYYPFDEDLGEIVLDASGGGRTATVHGATWVPDGVVGGAYRFDNIHQNITAKDAGLPDGDSARSVAAWIKLDRLYENNSTEYFSYGTRTYNQLTSLGLDWRLDRDRFNFSQYGGVFLSNLRLDQTGVWYHVLYTYGGAGTHAFYINGVRSDGMNELWGSIQTRLSGLLVLGGHPQNAGSVGPESGFLDEVMVFNRALTDSEALAMAARRTGASIPVSLREEVTGSCPAVITRVWTATDDCGSTVSATQTIAVVGPDIPLLLVGVPSNAIVECGYVPPPARVTLTGGCMNPFKAMGATLNPVNGHHYLAVSGLVSWTQASNLAQVVVGGVTGHLATITSTQEQAFIASVIPTTDMGELLNARIGGFEAGEGNWQWITGEPMPFTSWHIGEPNGGTAENYLAIVVVDPYKGRWNDIKNEPHHHFGMYMVEWDSAGTLNPEAVVCTETTNGRCPLVITRVWSAMDACGNEAVATQLITVVDTNPPQVTGPANWSLDVDRGCTVGELCCTRSFRYWRSHPDAWPETDLIIGATNLTPRQALRILWTPPRMDIRYGLAQQVLATLLNLAVPCRNDGSGTAEVTQTLRRAQSWLVEHPPGARGTLSGREPVWQWLAYLRAYNEGWVGPGSCRQRLPHEEAGCAFLPDMTPYIQATDSCSRVTLRQTPGPGTQLLAGMHTQVWIRAEDDCGGSTTLVIQVAVRDSGQSLCTDEDGDGVTMEGELIAGTDERSAGSLPQVYEILPQRDGTCVIRWPGTENRLYTVECSPSVSGPYDEVVRDWPAFLPVTEYHDDVVRSSACFYRVRVQAE